MILTLVTDSSLFKVIYNTSDVLEYTKHAYQNNNVYTHIDYTQVLSRIYVHKSIGNSSGTQ